MTYPIYFMLCLTQANFHFLLHASLQIRSYRSFDRHGAILLNFVMSPQVMKPQGYRAFHANALSVSQFLRPAVLSLRLFLVGIVGII